jgi:hypothetical protein
LWSTLGIVIHATAAAHLPHDEAYAVAVSWDLDPATPWALAHIDAMSRSDDGGASWHMVGGRIVADSAIAGGVTTSGEVVFCVADAVVWNTDAGPDWFEVPTPDSVTDCAVVGDTVFVATRSGLFSGPVTGPLVAELPETMLGLDVSGATLMAIERTGSVWRRSAVGWTDLGVPPGVPAHTQAATLGGVMRTFAGDTVGRVWVHDGVVWGPCGALPVTEGPRVVEMGYGDAALLVGTATDGPFVSFDGCSTWEDRRVPEPNFLVQLGAYPERGFSAMIATVDQWFVAGYSGVFTSVDQGLTWLQTPISPGARAQGVSYAADGRIHFGTWSAGPLYTDDGGVSVYGLANGIAYGDVMDVAAAPDDPSTVWSIVTHVVYKSEDGGDAWQAMGYPGQAHQVSVFSEPDEVFVTGMDGSGAVTLDRGATWLPMTNLEPVVPNALRVGRFTVSPGASRYVAAGGGRIAGATRHRGPWTVVADDPGLEQPTEVASFPPGRSGVIAVGGLGGVWVSTDDGASFAASLVTPDDPVDAVEFNGRGIAYAFTASGKVYRARLPDAWIDTGLRTPSRVLDAEPSRDHPSRVLLGTADGLWLISETPAGPVLQRWSGLERVDSANEWMDCDGCVAEQIEEASAAMGLVTAITPGTALTTDVHGVTVEVWGSITGPGEADVFVDGRWVATLGSASAPILPFVPELLVSVPRLDDSWHNIRIEHISGEGVWVDYVEGHAPAVALP